MKKFVPILIVLVIARFALINTSFAAPVDAATAQKVASNYYASVSKTPVNAITLAFTKPASDGSAAYYVFNINDNDGYVVATADDAAYPVIGYSTRGHYSTATVAAAELMWFGKRANEISYLKANHITATAEVSALWEKYMQPQSYSITRGGVSPLCLTNWSQIEGYNQLCPNQTPTGCTATAMGQIMFYWQYPVHGTGSISYVDSVSNGFSMDEGKLSADFGNTTYNWFDMPVFTVPGGPSLPSQQAAAVSALLYDCGVSMITDYNPGGSSANMIPYDSTGWYNPLNEKACSQTAYYKYFGYDSASMQGYQQDAYSQSDWIALLENELNAGRPIQYGGYVDTFESAGHCWVCDGYDANNNFDMNWGQGLFNTYCAIGAFDMYGIKLNSYDEVLMGIQPATAAGVRNVSEESLSIYPNPATDEIRIRSSQLQVANIQVFNMVGSKVYELDNQPVNSSTFNISQLPAGVYFLQLQSGSHVVNAKIEKQ